MYVQIKKLNVYIACVLYELIHSSTILLKMISLSIWDIELPCCKSLAENLVFSFLDCTCLMLTSCRFPFLRV